MASESAKIGELLGADADSLLNYSAKGFKKDQLHLPGPDFVDRVRRGDAIGVRRCCGISSRS